MTSTFPSKAIQSMAQNSILWSKARKSMTFIRFDQTLRKLFIRTKLSYTVFPLLKRSFVLFVLLLFLLEACSAGTSSTTAMPTATIHAARHLSPTPTRLPAGTALYQADWSHGLAGWSEAKGWKIEQ